MRTEQRANMYGVCILAMALSMPAVTRAAGAPDSTAQTVSESAVSPGGATNLSGTPPAAGLVTFDFKDTDINEILRAFSLRYGLTIVAGPEIRGNVTAMLADVPWEVALKQLVESCGYTLAKDGDLWRVISPPSAVRERAEAAASPTPRQAPQITSVPAEVAATQPPQEEASVSPTQVPAPSAEGTATVTPPTPAATETAGEKPSPQPTVKPGTPGRVTFDFKEADIVNILRIFSTRYGINIVAGPEVQGKVTIRLLDVPWETALKLILESNNYSYVKQNNVIRVMSRDKLDKEPLETQVYPLSYARANEIVKSVEHLLTPGRGQLKPDDRSNTLVVTDTPATLDRIEEIVARLDKRTPQILIESRIMELKDDFDENIGVNWVSLKGWDVTFGPPADEGMFKITREEVWGHEDSHADIFDDITTKTDTKSSTKGGSDSSTTTISTSGGTSGTDITSTDTSTSSSEKSTERLRQSGKTGIKNLSNPTGGSLGSQDTALQQRGSRVMTTDLRQAVLTPDNFQLTLSFLQDQTDANLISHPKLVTADNKDAVIKVVEQWPIPKFQFNNDTGQWEISDFEYKDIGVLLKVKPHVNEDDFINMKVVPEVSDILSFTSFGGATNAQLPIISTRTADTDVLIKNGQTLAIGGLMRQDESDLVNKMPLFGDIPVLGPYIFSNSSKTIRNRNIIIFITANVVTEDNKENLWITQREEQSKQLNLPKTKWWQPKSLRHGLGSEAGY